MNPVLQERDHRWFEQILARDPAATVAAVDVHLDELPPHAIAETSRGDMHMVEVSGVEDSPQNADQIEAFILVQFAIQAAVSRACAGAANA